MGVEHSDDLVAHVVAWHNQHPLARRIERTHVRVGGLLAVPFLAPERLAEPPVLTTLLDGGEVDNDTAGTARGEHRGAAGAAGGRHRDAVAAGAPGRGGTAHAIRRPAFAGNPMAPASRRRLLDWLHRHGAERRPAVSTELQSHLEIAPGAGDLPLALLWVHAAAIEWGSLRLRLLVAAQGGAAVFGRRLLSGPRVTAAIAVAASVLAVTAWAAYLATGPTTGDFGIEARVAPDKRATPPDVPAAKRGAATIAAAPAAMASAAAASTAARATILAAAPAGPGASPSLPTGVPDAPAADGVPPIAGDRPEAERPGPPRQPEASDPARRVEARVSAQPAGAPDPARRTEPASVAPDGDGEAPPRRAAAALPAPSAAPSWRPAPGPSATTGARPAPSRRKAPPVDRAPVRLVLDGQLHSIVPALDDETRVEARRAGMQAREERARLLARSPPPPAGTARAAVEVAAAPVVAAGDTQSQARSPGHVAEAVAQAAGSGRGGGVAAPAGYAVTTRRLRTRFESEQMLIALKAAAARSGRADTLSMQVMPAGDDFRTVGGPFDSRADAERLRALLAARGLKFNVVPQP